MQSPSIPFGPLERFFAALGDHPAAAPYLLDQPFFAQQGVGLARDVGFEKVVARPRARKRRPAKPLLRSNWP